MKWEFNHSILMILKKAGKWMGRQRDWWGLDTRSLKNSLKLVFFIHDLTRLLKGTLTIDEKL